MSDLHQEATRSCFSIKINLCHEQTVTTGRRIPTRTGTAAVNDPQEYTAAGTEAHAE
jgi:hypothetical protein